MVTAMEAVTLYGECSTCKTGERTFADDKERVRWGQTHLRRGHQLFFYTKKESK